MARSEWIWIASGAAIAGRKLASAIPATRSSNRSGLGTLASHLRAGMPGHLLHVHAAGSGAGPLRADALHIERELHLASLLEIKGDRHLVALLQRAFQIEHHQMISARSELHRLAGVDGEAVVERPHRHHA